MAINIDFETRSALDLAKVGAYVYAAHPTTRILCLGYRIEGAPTRIWWPEDPFPSELASAIEAGQEVHAWNAAFERLIWPLMVQYHGAPEIKIDQWRCTMVRALLMGFPARLEHAGPSMGLGICKDDAGHRLMLQLCKPRQRWLPGKKGYDEALARLDDITEEYDLMEDGEVVRWWQDPERLARLGEYCKRDVDVEVAAGRFLDPLEPAELRGWQMDQAINDRGFNVDTELTTKALAMVKPATKITNDALAHVSEGALTSVSKPNDIRAWINERTGLQLDSIAGDILNDLLVTLPHLPEDVKQVMRLRLAGAKTSTAKLRPLLTGKGPGDDRFRGGLQYAGAPRTNRWGGRRFQPQNLPRPPKWALEAVPFILETSAKGVALAFDSPLEAISAVIRACVKAAPGHELHFADYNAIEARFSAWLVGAVKILQDFREDVDGYRKMAGKVFGIEDWQSIDKDSFERFLGKQIILGSGFGMGPPKFQGQCRKFGQYIELPLAEKSIRTFRTDNPEYPAGWRDLERAALEAMDNPQQWVPSLQGRIYFWYDGATFLRVRLPSGRLLSYLAPHVDEFLTPWGSPTRQVSALQWNSQAQRMMRQSMYGGRWLENITQAGARDVMLDAMLRLHDQGWNLILSVHDECGAEERIGTRTLQQMVEVMEALLPWAPGLPLKVEGWTGDRYRK